MALPAFFVFWALSVVILSNLGKTRGFMCRETVNLANGKMINYAGTPQFECNAGFTLLERKLPFDKCKKGLLRGEQFFCAKKGCKDIQGTKNGEIVISDGLKTVLKCDEGFVLYGNKVTFCNGDEWSTDLGSCLKANESVQYFCDFEGEDLCGWESQGNQAWRRNSAANDFHTNTTGPQRDHTFDSETKGHFILMETGRSHLPNAEHFVSPIYPKDMTWGNSSCFQFHTFMFGYGVKDLVVSVKPESMNVNEMWEYFRDNFTKLTVSGDKGAHWRHYSFPIDIDEMEEDFQVVFTPTEPENYYGDIAIDDVKLTRGKCIAEKPEDSSTPTTKSTITSTNKGYCLESMNMSNGNVTLKRGRLNYECDSGYTLQGSLNDDCLKGLLRGERLFCGKQGCANSTDPPNGTIALNDGFKAVVKCDEGFVLYGNKVAYCNGKEWNTQLGSCKKTLNKLEYSCDFEAEDQCGWTAHSAGISPWKRISAANNIHSNKTGAQRDHTFDSETKGHFIRMETSTGLSAFEHFISPIFPKNLTLGNSLCFEFHIFMFGAGVQSLGVSVKNESLEVGDIEIESEQGPTKFLKSGDQGAEWLYFSIPIDEMNEDFQVVFTASEPDNFSGDIGIDDVKLTKGECRSSEIIESAQPPKISSKTTISGAISLKGWEKYTIIFSILTIITFFI